MAKMVHVGGGARVIGREEITLGGRKIELIHQDVPIDEVHLDPENPRVGYVVRSLGRKATEEQIRSILWGTSSVKALARQIRLNGGLIERPILQRVDGKGYIAREGNCRTTVYLKFHEQNPDDETWAFLPARVLPDDVDVREIMRLLGDFHVAGKNEWQPFEKGAYIFRMLEEFAFDASELATTLRMSKSSLYQFREAYKWMSEDYLPKYPEAQEGAERVRDFSHFLEFVKSVKKADPALKAEFVDWVGKGAFGMAIEVRDLPKILDTPGGREALAEKDYEAAMEIVADFHPEQTSKLFATLDRATRQLKVATFAEIEDLRSGNAAKVGQIKQLYNAIRDLAAVTGIDLSN